MQWYDVLIRLCLAILVGGAIGYEREYKNRPAGFRTHILVCIGAAVASMIEVYMYNGVAIHVTANPQLAALPKTDMGRLGAQVITGIGFLGAGTIMHEKGSIKGLTTAASIWVVACIGLGVGLGLYFLSISTTVMVFIVLVMLKKFENRFIDRVNSVKLELEYQDKMEFVKQVEEYFFSKNVKVKNIEFLIEEELDDVEYKKCMYTVLIPRYFKNTEIVQELYELKAVIKAKVI